MCKARHFDGYLKYKVYLLSDYYLSICMADFQTLPEISAWYLYSYTAIMSDHCLQQWLYIFTKAQQDIIKIRFTLLIPHRRNSNADWTVKGKVKGDWVMNENKYFKMNILFVSCHFDEDFQEYEQFWTYWNLLMHIAFLTWFIHL